MKLKSLSLSVAIALVSLGGALEVEANTAPTINQPGTVSEISNDLAQEQGDGFSLAHPVELDLTCIEETRLDFALPD